ncbi:MAG: hypothetical protein HZA12_04210 [Nitrospirae bacterium]|nr:hypothetical protein [Nitrospirota bacterium]
MHCPKCGGFMVTERCTDYSLVFYAWRCINCGTLIDNTILRNKKSPLLFLCGLLTIKV